MVVRRFLGVAGSLDRAALVQAAVDAAGTLNCALYIPEGFELTVQQSWQRLRTELT